MATGMMVAAAPASAAVPDLEYFDAPGVYDSQNYKEVFVYCPFGKVPLGGSFELDGAEGRIVLDDFRPFTQSTPLGTLHGMAVTAGEIVGPNESFSGTPFPWRIIPMVACGSPPPGYSFHAVNSIFAPGPVRDVTAVCAAGKQVIGGGAALQQGFGLVSIQALQISSTGVFARGAVSPLGYTGGWSISAWAICADPLPGWHVVEAESPVPVPPNPPFRDATAACQSGQQVLGAAWEVRRGTVIAPMNKYVTRTALTPGGATARAHQFPNSAEPWSVRARAVCVD